MGILGKDLFDLDRPYTHTKVQFGSELYWIEYSPIPQPYGATLTILLNYDATEYLGAMEQLEQMIAARDRHGIIESFLEVVKCFANLPFYRLYVQDYSSLEPEVFRAIYLDPGEYDLADRIIADDGRIMNKYRWAREDIQFIQRRYAWFLDKLAEGQVPEKKKGQRKHSLAEQVVGQFLEPYVSGRSLGEDREVDAPQVNVQYMIYEPKGGKPELVEKMYFDRLADFVYVEFMKGMQKGYIPKRCGNCGRWFLQKPGATYAYCKRIAPGETDKTCRDIGATASFQTKVQNNDIWKLHQRAYKKYHARVRKGTMTKAEFESWAREAEQLRDRALREYEHAEGKERVAITEGLRQELNVR